MSNQKMYEIAFRLGASVSPSLKAAIVSTNKRLSSLNNNSKLLEKSMIGVSKSVIKTASSTVKMAVAMSAVKVALAGVTAASAPVIAGVGALGASLASAGMGAAAFGAVAASAIGKVVEASGEVEKIEEKIAKADSAKERIAAQKELAAVYAGMSSEQRGALKNLQGFKSFWGGFVKGFEKPIFQAFGTSLQIAKNGLKLLGPTIQNVAGVVVELTEKFNTALKGSSMKGFFEWLSTNAAESLYNFAHVAGNALSGTMSLFQAFAPLGASMEEGLVGMTARFKEWAAGLSNSKGFQNFMEYAKANGPVLLGVVGNIVTVIKNLIVGLAPLGSSVLKVVESITGFIAKLTSTRTDMDAFKAKALEIFGKVQEFVLPLVSKVGSFVLNTFRKISSFWSENGSSIISALSKVFGVAGAVKDAALDIYSYISDPAKLMKMMMEKYGAVMPSFSGTFGDIGKGSFKMIKDKAIGYLKEKLSGIGGSGGNFSGGAAAPDQVKAWVAQALRLTGTDMSWMPAMLVKAKKESGYNPRAINLWDINAKRGIPSKGLIK
ncbi:hypothetical protein [Bacillus sp. ISL-57]|uniref:hypothetical protein n=1 Tax=Bacillus sp. ISL-57 TaxID=2819135 RepID=UPI001BECCA3B|nr:hypothetical protein [Bacillus sp. ISL-57]MBT2717553.1 hypothetical protein [Bacillus sp. ISL-57]